MLAELSITDGTTYVNLINGAKGFHLTGWRPAVLQAKGGGVWQDSPLASGRRMVMRQWGNVIDTFELAINGQGQDSLIRDVQELGRLLEKAVDYWTSDWQTDPVWIQARAGNETNTRYAIIHAWSIPELDNPYAGAFVAQLMGMQNINLILEHGIWLSNEPGTATCVEASAVETYCWPPHVEFDGDTTSIVVSDNAAIQDLHDDAMTCEAWIRPASHGESNAGKILCKDQNRTAGWHVAMSLGNRIYARIDCAVADGDSTSALNAITFDEWVHVAVTWDDTWGNTYPRIWIGGVETTYSATNNRNGAIVSDVGADLYIGNQANGNLGFDGDIGWSRVSDVVRYSATFTPPERCALPEIDANTVGQWIGAEQSGANIDDQAHAAATLDGTLSNGTFDCDCEHSYGNVLGGCIAPAFLEFNAVNSDVNCGSDPTVDNLQDDAYTAEAWVRALSAGEGNEGRIFDKSSNATLGWWFFADNVNGLEAHIRALTTDAVSYSGTDDFDPTDGLWHHVAMTFDDAGTRLIRLFVDGTEVSYPVAQQAAVGAIINDAARNLRIGNALANNRTFDGDIGWSRISDNLRYTANFTAPDRCTVPAVDGNTVMLVIYEGTGSTTYDLSGNGNDGAISSATWGCDCYPVSTYSGETLSAVTREPTCEDEVYVANKHNVANITHIYWYDASAAVYSANLMNAMLPYDLLPPAPADTPDDIVYFGIDTAYVDSGPFCSLVFDIGTAQTGITDLVWEYYQGAPTSAWTGLSVHDNTDADGAMTGEPFDTTGVNSVHWEQPEDAVNGDWVPFAVNGVTAYWIRCRVNTAAMGATPPTQQNRDVYSITWAYAEVQSADSPGDIPMLLRTIFKSEDNGVGTAVDIRDVVCGLRSVSRGEEFVAYINLGNEQNPTGLTTAYGANTAAADRIYTATGRGGVYNPPGAQAMADRITLTFSQALSRQFYGTYHAYIRTTQEGGADGDFTVELTVDFGMIMTTDAVQLPGVFASLLTDLGKVQIAPVSTLDGDDAFNQATLTLRASNANAAPGDLVFMDLILIPVDELAIHATRGAAAGLLYFYTQALDIDSVLNPKQRRRIFVRYVADESITAIWQMISPGVNILQANARQRIWFLSHGQSLGESIADVMRAYTVQLTGTGRYLAMRGDR